jgi:hypothetical protein
VTLSPTPILSILIPTKDRYGTLLPVINALTTQIPDQRLEFVICDNSANPNLEQVALLTGGDMRISYAHSAQQMSIVENTERGIGLCRGEFICFIGDDDLVSPHILSVVEWLKSRGGDCLIYPPARYWWSSVVFAKETRSQRPGVFWLPLDRDGAVRVHDSAEELATVLARGGVSYIDLPRLYHGVVSRRAVDRIFAQFGRYVPGSSPDMALCLALALTNAKYLRIAYPLTVFGASRNSGGGLTAARRHFGRIEDQSTLPRDILANWDPRLPRIWSEQVIYPQTIHEVLSRVGRKNTVSLPTLYGSLIAYEPHIARHLWPILADFVAEHPSRIIPLVANVVLKIAGRMRTSLRSRTGKGMPFEFHNIADIDAVMSFMAKLPPPDIRTAAR